NRYEPPPEFPLTSFYSGIVHHLSGPSEGGSHLGRPKTTLAFTAPLGFVPPNDSRAC
ncbi:unnamed protein product, partial [Candidula unifasciata]